MVSLTEVALSTHDTSSSNVSCRAESGSERSLTWLRLLSVVMYGAQKGCNQAVQSYKVQTSVNRMLLLVILCRLSVFFFPQIK